MPIAEILADAGLLPVMARTHFAAMFDSLGDAAELITPDEIIACWGQSARVKRMQMFPLGYVDGSRAGKKDVHGVNHGPTIGAWLDSIAGDASFASSRRTRGCSRRTGRRSRGGCSTSMRARAASGIPTRSSPRSCGARTCSDGARRALRHGRAPSAHTAALGERVPENYGRRELSKAALSVPEHEAHASVGLAAGVEALRSATAKALAAAKTNDAFLAVIDSFAAGYAKLRALFVTLEPARDPAAPRPSGRDFGEGGNCLFDSTAAMLADGQTAAQLRQLTARRVRLHPLEYVDRLVNGGDHGEVMEEMRDAADLLAVSGNWDGNAGEIAPIALAEVLAGQHRHLVILNADGSVRYTGPGAGDPMFIYYNGVNHYTPAEG